MQLGNGILSFYCSRLALPTSQVCSFVLQDNLVLSTELIMRIGHRKEIRK